MAVSAYLNKRVSRIVLTRPAVEAGEHLGFPVGGVDAHVLRVNRGLGADLAHRVAFERHVREAFVAVIDVDGPDGERLHRGEEAVVLDDHPVAHDGRGRAGRARPGVRHRPPFFVEHELAAREDVAPELLQAGAVHVVNAVVPLGRDAAHNKIHGQSLRDDARLGGLRIYGDQERRNLVVGGARDTHVRRQRALVARLAALQ